MICTTPVITSIGYANREKRCEDCDRNGRLGRYYSGPCCTLCMLRKYDVTALLRAFHSSDIDALLLVKVVTTM